MRLASARSAARIRGQRLPLQRRRPRSHRIESCICHRRRGRQQIAGNRGRTGISRRGIERVAVRRHRGLVDGDRTDPARLAEVVSGQTNSLAHMDRQSGLQIGQRESGLAVAAIGGAKQREQRLILDDRQELTVAQRPAPRREVAAKHADLAKKWFTHPTALSILIRCALRSVARWEDTLQGNDEIDRQVRLQISVRLTGAERLDRAGIDRC